jgi:phage-related protein
MRRGKPQGIEPVCILKLYQTADGKQPIKDYPNELSEKTDRDSRMRLGKIDYYLQALRTYGTRAGEPYVKHIECDLWELRPLNDRFFFFARRGDRFILLHHFIKKTQKTPKREIDQAKRNLKDFVERERDNE